MTSHEVHDSSNQEPLPIDAGHDTPQDNVIDLNTSRDAQASRRYNPQAEALQQALEEQDIDHLVDTMGISYEEAEQRVRGSTQDNGAAVPPVPSRKPLGRSFNEGNDSEHDVHWREGMGEWLTPSEVARRTIGLEGLRKVLRHKKTSG